MNTPPELAGTMGAVFNASLQLGASVSLAIVTTITTSLNARRSAQGLPIGYKGAAAGFWYVLALVGVQIIALLVFYKVPKQDVADAEKGGERASDVEGDDSGSTGGRTVGGDSPGESTLEKKTLGDRAATSSPHA